LPFPLSVLNRLAIGGMSRSAFVERAVDCARQAG
jgi:hypothetical protein